MRRTAPASASAVSNTARVKPCWQIHQELRVAAAAVQSQAVRSLPCWGHLQPFAAQTSVPAIPKIEIKRDHLFAGRCCRYSERGRESGFSYSSFT